MYDNCRAMGKVKTKKPSRELKQARLICRVNGDELDKIFKKAFIYCKGNMSEYLREAAIRYERSRK